MTTTYPAGDRRSLDSGFSLIEAVVTIALTATIVISILAAVRTSIQSSSTVYTAAQVETVLLNAADRVGRAPQGCAYDQYVEAATLAEGWSADLAVASVEKLVAATGNPADDWAPQTCAEAVAKFDVQRLTITITSPDGQIRRTMTVMKGDVT